MRHVYCSPLLKANFVLGGVRGLGTARDLPRNAYTIRTRAESFPRATPETLLRYAICAKHSLKNTTRCQYILPDASHLVAPCPAQLVGGTGHVSRTISRRRGQDFKAERAASHGGGSFRGFEP